MRRRHRILSASSRAGVLPRAAGRARGPSPRTKPANSVAKTASSPRQSNLVTINTFHHTVHVTFCSIYYTTPVSVHSVFLFTLDTFINRNRLKIINSLEMQRYPEKTAAAICNIFLFISQRCFQQLKLK